jgi:hypothetical protein
MAVGMPGVRATFGRIGERLRAPAVPGVTATLAGSRRGVIDARQPETDLSARHSARRPDR